MADARAAKSQQQRCGLCYLKLPPTATPITSREVLRLDRRGGKAILQPFDIPTEQSTVHLPPSVSQSTTISSLAKSASRGCQGCQALHLVVRHSASQGHPPTQQDPLVWEQSQPGSPWYLSWSPFGQRVRPPRPDPGRAPNFLSMHGMAEALDDVEIVGNEIVNFQLFSPSSDNIDHPFIARGILPSGDTASHTGFYRLRKWLQTCLDSHKACGDSDPTILPTRVLQIKYTGDPVPQVKLVETDGKTSGRYACLSYCWGPNRPANLTSMRTLAVNKAGIDWQSIARTYQDAIVAVSRIGLEYIWIDSFCIVQDDEKDWLRETSLMAEIFKNALFTVSATSSSHCDEGVFFDISDVYTAQHVTSTPRETPAFFRQKLPHPPWAKNEIERLKETFPLLSRAWAYQERLISPRTIHFTENEIFWECREDMKCECGGHEITDVGNRRPNKLLYNQLVTDWSASKVTERWHEIVYGYSGLDIAFEKDRLPAISGVARQIGAQHAERLGKYLAGLWERTLLRDLIWFRRSPVAPRPHGDFYATWSWASIEGQVAYPLDEEAYENTHTCTEIKVLHVHYDLASEDEYGRISSAYLTLSGLLAPAVLQYEIRGLRPNQPPTYWVRTGRSAAESMKEDYALFEPGPAFVAPGSTVFCFKTGCSSQINEAAGSSIQEYCLVLRPLGSIANAYERIGIIRADQKTVRNSWFRGVRSESVVKLF